MNTQLPKLVFAVVAALSLTAAPALCGAPDVSFETITLTHLTAAEVAPLLGPHFQLSGQPIAPPRGPTRGLLAGFVPEGIAFITAGHQSSHHLLVAGTPQAAAELRALLRRFDVRPKPVHLTLTIYPTAADLPPTASTVALGSDTRIAIHILPPGKQLAFAGLPTGFHPPQIALDVADQRLEFIPLPRFTGWPQILLGAVARAEGDGSIILSVSAGLLGDPADPAAAVEQARGSSLNAGLTKGQSLALILSRPDSAATVVIRPTT